MRDFQQAQVLLLSQKECLSLSLTVLFFQRKLHDLTQALEASEVHIPFFLIIYFRFYSLFFYLNRKKTEDYKRRIFYFEAVLFGFFSLSLKRTALFLFSLQRTALETHTHFSITNTIATIPPNRILRPSTNQQSPQDLLLMSSMLSKR